MIPLFLTLSNASFNIMTGPCSLFSQLLGISVPGLEPEFLPVVNHLSSDIIAHKQDGLGVHLQVKSMI